MNGPLSGSGTFYCYRCHRPCVPNSILQYPIGERWGEVVIGECCVIAGLRAADHAAELVEASIARRVAEYARPTASWLRHRDEHADCYVPACEFCRRADAA